MQIAQTRLLRCPKQLRYKHTPYVLTEAVLIAEGLPTHAHTFRLHAPMFQSADFTCVSLLSSSRPHPRPPHSFLNILEVDWLNVWWLVWTYPFRSTVSIALTCKSG